jgi:hypothetical protein
MTVDGIGHITAACSHTLVCALTSGRIMSTKLLETVYYRSKDSKLPDAVPGPGGEVFFDVRTKTSSEIICTPSPCVSQTYCQVTALFL